MTESTLTTPNNDSLKIRGEWQNVVLPSGLVSTLMPTQIDKMKQTVFTVRNNSRIAGELVRSTASTLYDMKRNLRKNSEWIAFLKSGALPIPEKQARDLVAAWEGWMSDTAVSDGDLVGLGTRTLAKMKNLSPGDRKKVISKNKKGEKVTEAEVTEMAGDSVKPFSPKATGRTLKSDKEEATNLNRYSKSEVIQFVIDANKKIKELEGELEFATAG